MVLGGKEAADSLAVGTTCVQLADLGSHHQSLKHSSSALLIIALGFAACYCSQAGDPPPTHTHTALNFLARG